jgi:xanthine dehydrogenase iron-sulfur cluster and FAD-binding subunit A
LIQTISYLLWKTKAKFLKKNITNSLRSLLNDVERYNAIIKAININDQIESAGNPEVCIQQREKVIQALNMTKLDLVRALKTEKILRENKNFILTNSDLFANNLAALAAIKVTEEATEHDRLLNEALQIALDVQSEMRRLQNQH